MTEDRFYEVEKAKNLYRCLIMRGIRDYIIYKSSKNRRQLRLHEEAKSWIFDEPLENKTGQDISTSFDMVCMYIDWDADKTREAIKKMTKADLKRMCPNGFI